MHSIQIIFKLKYTLQFSNFYVILFMQFNRLYNAEFVPSKIPIFIKILLIPHGLNNLLIYPKFPKHTVL